MTLAMQNIQAMVNCVRDAMAANQDYLIELDQALGDGDLGLSMTKGFTEAAKAINESESADIGRVLVQAGMAFNNAAPSTMGTLMATAFIRAGKSVLANRQLILRLGRHVRQQSRGYGAWKGKGRRKDDSGCIVPAMEYQRLVMKLKPTPRPS